MNKPAKDIFVAGAIAPAQIADSITKHSAKKEIGAHSIFLGQIRADEVAGKTVCAIEYTNHKTLALEKMSAIREAVFEKYNLTCMHVYHSEGIVNAGEICFFVFTSSQHREAAIKACEEIVERVKKELPIWGKEIFEDESHQWKVNR
ncbi:MAG: molybdenum cofactor biosynthesis protein MoaE [Chitinophagaceae bacterium]|jgi:molybdopterin synthase catalytic subunit|nr:molybdenum cofactor biosynthesis protein MoaE [Chitinophagaceae bacterium]